MIVGPQIQDTQCGSGSGRGTTNQLFTLRQVFEKGWKLTRPIYIAIIDLDKADDRILRELLWNVLKEYGVSGCLLAAIRSLYDDCKIHVRINGSKSGLFGLRVGLWQGCVLSPLLFIIFMDRISRRNITLDCVKLGNARVESPLFADNVARLASSSAGL